MPCRSFQPADKALVQIIGPFAQDDTFEVQDLEALIAYERTKRIDAVVEALADVVPAQALTDLFARTSRPDLLARLSNAVSLASLPPTEESFTAPKSAKRSRDYRQIPGNYTSFVVGDEDTAVHQFGVILDPLSETAQSWSAILEVRLSNVTSKWLISLTQLFSRSHDAHRRYRTCPASLCACTSTQICSGPTCRSSASIGTVWRPSRPLTLRLA